MPGPTTAALERDVNALKDRIRAIEVDIRELRGCASNDDLDDLRKMHDTLKDEFHRLGGVVGDLVKLDDRVGILEDGLKSHDEYRASNRWIIQVVERAIMWLLCGGGVIGLVAWLLWQLGSRSQ